MFFENKKKYGGVLSEYCWFKKTKVLKRTCWKLKKDWKKIGEKSSQRIYVEFGAHGKCLLYLPIKKSIKKFD